MALIVEAGRYCSRVIAHAVNKSISTRERNQSVAGAVLPLSDRFLAANGPRFRVHKRLLKVERMDSLMQEAAVPMRDAATVDNARHC